MEGQPPVKLLYHDANLNILVVTQSQTTIFSYRENVLPTSTCTRPFMTPAQTSAPNTESFNSEIGTDRSLELVE